jgi:hypothetical protein
VDKVKLRQTIAELRSSHIEIGKVLNHANRSRSRILTQLQVEVGYQPVNMR